MKRFKNILLIDDAEHQRNNALQRAISLAENNQADLTIIRVFNLPHDTVLPSESALGKFKNAITEEWHDQLARIIENKPTGINISGKLIFGELFPQIVQEVLRSGYDLVMKSAEENHGLKNRIFGSADMHLLRKCPCPVWIVQTNEKNKYQRIIAAVDVEQPNSDNSMSSLNRQILEMATSLALSEFSELHVVHSWTAVGESVLSTPRFSFAEEEVAEWAEQQKVMHEAGFNDLMKALSEMISQDTMEYLNPKLHFVKGKPHEVIPSLAREIMADLVVMGTVARTGIPGLIVGNTAESILNNIECSVLAVKPSGFVTPVTLEK